MIIARYNNVIAKIDVFKKMTYTNGKTTIKFLQFFEGTDEAFIMKFKPLYPNYKFQIFKHNRKPLEKTYRKLIEDSTEVKSKLREYNLSKLLN